MATNDPKINQARVMTMFMVIRNDEMKNVRTLQYESKDMVKRITNYIVRRITAFNDRYLCEEMKRDGPL